MTPCLRYLLFATAMAVSLTLPTYSLAQSQPTAQEQALLKQMREAAKRQGLELTPEMEAQALQRMRSVQADMLGLQMAIQSRGQQQAVAPSPAQAAPQALIPAPAAQPAGEWLARIEQHKASARPTVFEDAPDGFLADSRPWLDTAGEIQWYGADRRTGNVTYFVRKDGDTFDVRFANVHSGLPSVLVGSLTASENRDTYQGLDGTTLSGEQIIPLASGLVATRSTALFNYEFGKQPEAHTFPAEYGVLHAQRGDVVGTGYLLVVKKARRTFGDNLFAASGVATRKMPTTFGKRDPDFALMDIHTGELVVLPRSEATTDIPWKSRFREDGRRNSQHYYNAIDWQQTSLGTVALVFGDDSATLLAVEIPSGRQTTVLKRGLGINEWRSQATPDGGIRVEAQLGFKHEAIEDVRNLISSIAP